MSIWQNDKVQKALLACKFYHKDQRRKYTNEPYWHHPIRVAKLVDRAGLGPSAVCAALLHDTIEDADNPRQVEIELRAYFGLAITQLVLGLTEPKTEGNRAFRKALEAHRLEHQGYLVQSIKFADLYDNSKSIIKRDPSFAKVYLKEKEVLLNVMTKGHRGLHKLAYEVIKNDLHSIYSNEKTS